MRRERDGVRDTEGTEKTEKFVELNRKTEPIIGAAIAVHRALGPGLLESAYEACLAYELIRRGLPVERHRPIPVVYDGVTLECGFRADLIVGDEIIVEVKTVEGLNPIHDAQLLTYLRLTGCKAGLLVNFNVRLLRDGIRRLLNGF